MISLECDYNVGAHPAILQRLSETNLETRPGYGCDDLCESAAEKIRLACQCPEGDVYFLTGGTQTNSTVIASMLQAYEGVVAADTGHIASHEAGAVEYTGHKVLTIPHKNGKIPPEVLNAYLKGFFEDSNHEHMVFPGMVYISHPTEYGTLYTRSELERISSICKEYQIPLFLDGARLGYGLMSHGTDVTLPDIARLCDVFYIGGTKVGALFGEAVVFTRQNTPPHFVTQIKQHGALLAKGFLLGLQFDTLFTDDLYFKISKHAIDMADYLKEILLEKGCQLYLDSPTNQQFILMEDSMLSCLDGQVAYRFWEKPDPDHTVIRLVTSWATPKEDLDRLKEILPDPS